MRDSWFNKFLGRIDDDEIYDELVNYEVQEDNEEFYREFIRNNKGIAKDWEFDDNWLTKDFLEDIYENKDDGSHRELGVYSFEGDLYLSFIGTQQHSDLSYIMQHSN